MIDKSIRQHYQDGKKVDQLKKWTTELMSSGKEQILPSEKSKVPNIIKAPLQRAALNKLGLAGLNPILGLLSLFGIDPIAWLTKKMTKGGVQQAFTAGMTGTQADRESAKELRVLEKRRADMLQRKDEGKNYSERNLDIVTRAIAEAKGLDINNPNEMKNIDKPITQIQIEKSITEPSRVIPKTPEIISPHLLGGDETITPPKISPISYEDDFATTTIKDILDKKTSEDIITPPVWNPGIAAQEEEAANRAAEEKAAANRAMQETIAKAERDAAAARATVSVPVPAHISGGGGNGGNQGSTSSSGGYSRGDYGGRGHHWAKGGRVDKALGGRSRDIG